MFKRLAVILAKIHEHSIMFRSSSFRVDGRMNTIDIAMQVSIFIETNYGGNIMRYFSFEYASMPFR